MLAVFAELGLHHMLCSHYCEIFVYISAEIVLFLQVKSNKYHISTKDNMVYDVTKRKVLSWIQLFDAMHRLYSIYVMFCLIKCIFAHLSNINNDAIAYFSA